MRTLESEYFDGREVLSSTQSSAELHRVMSNFLHKYGSYRVVEGVLHASASGKVWLSGAIGACAWETDIGKRGDSVKLLLPPEEKEQQQQTWDELSRKYLQAASEKRDAQHRVGELEQQVVAADGDYACMRARADKYEKVLREIDALPEERKGMKSRWGQAVMDGYRIAASIAREALDDTEC